MNSVWRQITSWLLPIGVLVVIPALLVEDFQIHLDALVVIGLALVLFGLFILIMTIGMFARIGRGTLAPWSPPQALVTTGIYGYVRNPMISGVMITLLGESLVFHSARLLVWFLLVWVVNDIYFRVSEEPGLVKRFGDEYAEYKRNVPRWIPRARPWKPEEQDHVTERR